MERRLAAILAVDVVGYSRLTEVDEEGTLARLKAVRNEVFDPCIAEHHGRIVKLMGDGALVEFVSVVDAVRCAIEAQRDVSAWNSDIPQSERIEFRIGINLGDVVVEDDDIYGDGVNIAARLEGLADPGGICISGTVFDHVKTKLDVGFESLGAQRVKNLSEPVRTFRVLLDGFTQSKNRGAPTKAAWRRRIAAAAIAIVIAIAGVAAWWEPWAPDIKPASVERMAFPLPERPSIAVLPFDNLSGDAAKDYIPDGITEDIITALSRFHELFVIARNSTFTYKDKAVKVQQVAEELGVRYVLEGSYRQSNDGLRITVQLIDALSGTHVWAETYNRNASGTLAIQDEIVEAIVTALAVKIEEAETRRAVGKATTSLEAYDYFLRARDLQKRKGFWDRKVNEEVRQLQVKATDLDPRFSRAYTERAWTHLYDFIFKWTDAPKRSLGRAFELAQKAVSLEPSSARAHYILGYAHLYAKEHDLAAAEVEKAIALNPNDARFRAGLAGLYIYGGQPERAIKQIREAMRLNPYHEDWYWHFLGWASFHAGRYEEGLQALNRIVNPGAGDHRMLAATYVRLGRPTEAAKHAEAVLEIEPDFVVSHFRDNLPYKNESDAEDYLEALSRAGLPQ